ncbi:hydrophobic protein [Streptomyces erythrochromogenes]
MGFAVEILWWFAIALLVVRLLGFFARPNSGSGRWYRW